MDYPIGGATFDGAPSMTTADRKRVIIIGAGIVGVAAAVWLQRDGHDVVLIDKDGPATGASAGNGGVLASCSVVPVTVPSLMTKAPGMLLRPDSPLFMRWSYLPKLLPWLARYLSHCRPFETKRIAKALAPIISDSIDQHLALAKGTPAERYVKPSDYLFIYPSRASFEGDRFGWDLRAENGFTWDLLDKEAFRAYDPAFGPGADFAVKLGNHGHITDPEKYVQALAGHVVAEGGQLVTTQVTGIRQEAGSVVGVETSNGPINGDAVVLAAGVWSRDLAATTGLKVPLESERGYHIDLINPNIMPRSPVMVAAAKFVATPMEGRLRCAGIVEFGGITAPPSNKPFALLKKRIHEALPGLTYDSIEEWMGHRPAPTDSIPVIGKMPGPDGCFAGFGHHHIGMTGGPKTGRLLADMIAGRRANIDLEPYRPARFA